MHKKQAMAKVIFKSQSINAPELFPVNIFDKIPENHPVLLVDQVVNSLDISTLLKKHKGGGTSAYHPRMMPAPQSLRLCGCVCQSVTDIKLNPKQGRLETENHYLKVGDFAEP